MTTEHLIAFNLTLFVAILSPGPAMLATIQTTLSAGRRAGMILGAGLGTMAVLWLICALLGLNALFAFVPWAYGAAKFIGAVYLIYLAWQIWTSAHEPLATGQRHYRWTFAKGFLINALNPKCVVFASAVLLVIFPGKLSISEQGLLVVNQFLIEIIFYTTLSLTMSTPAIRDHYLRAKLYIDRFASVILGALGLRLLVDR